MGGRIRKPQKMKDVPLSEAGDDEFEHRLLNDPRFLKRIESARKSLRAGKGTRLDDVDW